MSFRSRSRTTQQPVVRRRSLSGSRVSNPVNSYSNNRPLSSVYPSTYSPAYVNPYSSRDNLFSASSARNSYRRDSYGGGTGYKSPYADRYISPYTSYDNGITTAGLSLKSSPYTNGYNYTKSSLSKASDYPLRHSSSLYGSNTSLSSYTSLPAVSVPKTSTVGRSQSFKDHERKSRNCRRTPSLQSTRSVSVSSEKSEGYESGSEKTSTRSRLGSTSSATSEQSPTTDASENGELIDYKALYEAVKAENDKLRVQLKKKDDEVVSTKAAIERFTNATTKNSLTELEKREKRAMERKISEMEEELKQLQKFKQENERLRAENRALTRVVSKLTISAQNQLQNRK